MSDVTQADRLEAGKLLERNEIIKLIERDFPNRTKQMDRFLSILKEQNPMKGMPAYYAKI
jgi:hypothetical protein